MFDIVELSRLQFAFNSDVSLPVCPINARYGVCMLAIMETIYVLSGKTSLQRYDKVLG